MTQRLLGIDYGRVRIGLAVSDALGFNATPLGFVKRQNDAQAATVVAVFAWQAANRDQMLPRKR